jgi:predicted RNase H-like HicB family nuclease
MEFYTTVLRKSDDYWVALCLENGLVGQGKTKKKAIQKLKEAIDSYDEVARTDDDVYNAPLSIKELHEFLTVETREPGVQSYELRAVYA